MPPAAQYSLCGIDAEHLPAPRIKLDEQPINKIISGAYEGQVVGWVCKTPLLSPEVVPRGSHHPGGCGIAEIDHDQPARFTVPAPGDKVLVSIISRPSGSIAQLPPAQPECWVSQSSQK
jgi:hypothetical protein